MMSAIYKTEVTDSAVMFDVADDLIIGIRGINTLLAMCFL